MCSDFTRIKSLPVFVGFAAGVLLWPAAAAQEPGSSTTTYTENNGAPEEVTITSPRRAPTRSTIGAPIEDVAVSAPVSIRGLDLHTGEGVYTMRQRVKYTARSICNRLSFRYPIGEPDSNRCYRRAISYAMPQADTALWNYRSPGSM